MADYLLHLAVMLSIYVLLTYSLNLLAGEAGLLAFCTASFWGVGAYAAALASVGRAAPPYLEDLGITGAAGLEWTLPLATAAGMVVGLLAAAAALRFRNDMFILATLAVQALGVSLFENSGALTRGPAGLYGLPAPALFHTEVPLAGYASLAGAVAAAVAVAHGWVRHTRFGVQLRALRDHEPSANALGVPPTRRYLAAFAISGAVAGLAGGLYVGRIPFIDPGSFGLSESILLVTALLLGGRGTPYGPLLGAAVLVLLPESLRFVGAGLEQSAALRSALMGLALVLLMFLRPRGLLGRAK